MPGVSYQLVLFDLDGVLFDFQKAEAQALMHTFSHFQLPVEPDYLNVYRTINRRFWADFEQGRCTPDEIKRDRFPRFLDQIGVRVDGVRFGRQYLTELGRCNALLGDPVPVLQLLSGHVRMALLTNGLEDVQRNRLATSPIRKFFPHVFISEELGVAKPDSAIFRYALEDTGVTEERAVLMVGDSLSSDIRGGHDAGLDTCWFNPDRRPLPDDVPIPTHQIVSLTELPPLVLTG